MAGVSVVEIGGLSELLLLIVTVQMDVALLVKMCIPSPDRELMNIQIRSFATTPSLYRNATIALTVPP